MAELPTGDDWMEGTLDDVSIIHKCYCVNCHENNGITTMLPTKVPFFREIIIMSFNCPDCHYNNNEINFGGEIQKMGEKIVLHVTSESDLNRQIIKSDSATVYLPDCYELEIPKTTQRGNVSTLEGFLKSAANNLNALQAERLRLGDIDNFHRCRNVIDKLLQLAGDSIDDDSDNDDDDNEEKMEEKSDNGNTHAFIAEKAKITKASETANKKGFVPFTIIMDDPAGNSYIENPLAPDNDPNLICTKYYRTPTQDMSLGLQPSMQAMEEGAIDDTNPLHKNVANIGQRQQQQQSNNGGGGGIEINDDILLHKMNGSGKNQVTTDNNNNAEDELGIGKKEVISFTSSCPHCYKIVETNMCVVDIPHFKEVIIMSLTCDQCGYKSNEIKGGGGIPKHGTEITLRVVNENDLSREILKSDTAGIQIPELELELAEGGLDGVYTTVEGLLQKLYDRLERANPFSVGDSAVKQHLTNDKANAFSNPSPNILRYKEFLQKLKNIGTGKSFPFTIIISDPLSNSFIGPIAKDAVELSLQAERDGNNDCYDTYVDRGMDIHEFERTFDQNEILGLNDIKTENYQVQQQQHNADDGTTDQHVDTKTNIEYYGTDTMEDLPDRIRRIDVRGPDHPHQVGKAPVDNDTTIMGPGSLNFAVPSIGQRGTKKDIPLSTSTAISSEEAVEQRADSNNDTETNTSNNATSNVDDDGIVSIRQMMHDAEKNDDAFMMNDEYSGFNDGMIFKDGAQGIGYYKDIPLLDRWTTTLSALKHT